MSEQETPEAFRERARAWIEKNLPRAGEAQGRRGQQEARAAEGAQPIGEVGEVPDFAEIDAELE